MLINIIFISIQKLFAGFHIIYNKAFHPTKKKSCIAKGIQRGNRDTARQHHLYIAAYRAFLKECHPPPKKSRPTPPIFRLAIFPAFGLAGNIQTLPPAARLRRQHALEKLPKQPKKSRQKATSTENDYFFSRNVCTFRETALPLQSQSGN